MLDSKNSQKPGPCSGTGTARLQSLLLICIQPHEGKKQHLGKEPSSLGIADLKGMEAALVVRAAYMSADQRNQVTNQAINILRTNNAGPEAEAEVRRIMGVE
jgi:hypothetical protein